MKHSTAAALLMGTAMTLGLTHVAQAQAGNNTGVLNPNLAGEEQLLALTELNESLVEAIIDNRPFLTMTAFDEFLKRSLGDAARTSLYVGLFVPINLNTATREEILLVPGAGPRMAHEFEEYRPYIALSQFRREIGKYVDESEVARLEQYAFVPIDLNTASAEDILSIPGVGPRMHHEFEEYRPYQSIAQFRREMGKYVDEGEVARLERYVVIR